MPLHLEPLDVSTEFEHFHSVLIAACPICPPMSLAMQTGSPFIEFFKRGVKTRAFEDYIKEVRERLECRGIRTGSYTAYLPCPTMCLWTKGQRRRFLKHAKAYEAVLVMGCDSAMQTAEDTLADTDCQVVQAMKVNGVTNATLKFRFPMTLELQRSGTATTTARKGSVS